MLDLSGRKIPSCSPSLSPSSLPLSLEGAVAMEGGEGEAMLCGGYNVEEDYIHRCMGEISTFGNLDSYV